MCGEKSFAGICKQLTLGSPPRVWGKARTECFFARMYRITPTCVGKRNILLVLRILCEDHPHVCGEKPIQLSSIVSFSGSPPRVWGKVQSDCTFTKSSGITPTCVGKSKSDSHISSQIEDHPHVCGEKPLRQALLMLPVGSPPRVWGKEKSIATFSSDHGITPTCVGKSA